MGATAYSEALSIGCAPTILPATRLLEQHNNDDFLYVVNVQVDDGSCIVDLASVLRAVACVVY